MLYGDKVIHTERLTVPHYGLKEREFMLYPLAEIAPDLIFPDGEPLASCLKRVPENGMALWHQPNPSPDPPTAPTAQQTRPPGDWRN